MPNVGINGFCRIGRVVLRTCLENSEIQVTAINDPAIDIEYMCYLIKHDSTHGKLKADVSLRRFNSEIKINDSIIKIFHEKSPSKIPWQLANVQYVVEASGMFTSMEKASTHLLSGSVKQVIVTAPSVNIPMLILGVNEKKFNFEHKVISTTSSTLYCLAPIIKILEDNFGVSEGFVTSIHAMTPSLKPLDGLCLRGKYWRDHRSIHQNIIPASTGACKALGKIIPSVKDKLAGSAFRVPIVNVSVLDVTVRLNTPTSLSDIWLAVEKKSTTRMKNIIRISTEEAVSSDFMNDTCSCIIDAESSLQLRPNFFKIICWYENEYSYACRVVDSILYKEKMIKPQLALELKFSTPKMLNKNRYKHGFNLQRGKSTTVIKRQYSDTSTQESGAKNKAPTHVSDVVIPITGTMLNNLPDCEKQCDSSDVTNPDLNTVKSNTDSRASEQQNNKPNTISASTATTKTFTRTIPTFNVCQAQQERLEKVKKEFDKVASITEDLLNKSKMYNEDMLTISNESIQKDLKKPLDDPVSNLTYVKSDSTSNKKNMRKFSECSEEVRNWNLEDSHMSSDSQNMQDSAINNKPYENPIQTHETKPHSQENKPSSHSGDNNLNKEPEKQNAEESKENDRGSVEILEDIKAEYSMEDTSVESSFNNVMQEIDEEIKCTSGYGQVFETMNHEMKYDRYFNSNNIGLRKHSSKNLDNVPSVSNVRVKAENLNSSVQTNKDLNDLYDKLDSVSNSASDDSLPDKKSQIIKFSDLSHSMDELEKIDKFCRLIEISDELSDSLFAALNKNGSPPKNEWSFNELCKKINIDEFCKKMIKKSKCPLH